MCLPLAELFKSHVYLRKIATRQSSVMGEALEFIEKWEK